MSRLAALVERLPVEMIDHLSIATKGGLAKVGGTANSMASVYVVSNAANSLLKVGYTTAFLGRFSMLRTSSPVVVRLEHIVWFADAMIARRVEGEMHTHLADKRRHGEWFDSNIESVLAVMSNVVERGRLPFVTETERRQWESRKKWVVERCRIVR